MKSKSSARHIIPVVCYAFLFLSSVATAVFGFLLDFTSSESLEDTGMIGLLVVSLFAAAKILLILIGIGGAAFSLFPLTFSAINLSKRSRNLTVACLVFDVIWCLPMAFAVLINLFDFDGIVPLFAGMYLLALGAIPLAMNVRTLKSYAPAEPEPQGDETVPEEITL